uniref:vomeronasal type-2 receptor 26-like n=1 Tax=Podarcis muralis TaxID=64176 RepID=UPI00109FA173|nr:vomeronasal type-2 receptor 26-like [Podarcis muralis]
MTQFTGIIRLILYFRWTWIGVVFTGDDNSEKFLQVLEGEMQKNGVCTEFILKMYNRKSLAMKTIHKMEGALTKSSVNVTVFYGSTSHFFQLQLLSQNLRTRGKIWIITAQWDFTAGSRLYNPDSDPFQDALSFAVHKAEIPQFRDFLQSVNPKKYPNDVFMKYFWGSAFDCVMPPPYSVPRYGKRKCTERERLDSLPVSVFDINTVWQSYSIYNAVYAVAHALMEMRYHYTGGGGRRRKGLLPPWQVL